MANSWKNRKKYVTQKEKSNEEVKKTSIHFTHFMRRQMYLTIMSIVGVFLVIMGSSYAVFTSLDKSIDYNTVTLGTLEISYDDTSDGLGDIINLNGAFPISDEEGMGQTGYKFRLYNTGSLTSDYVIKVINDTAMIDADECQDNLLPNNVVKYSIDGEEAKFLENAVDGIIKSGSLKPSDRITHEVKMWIDENAGNEILGKHYHGKIVIEAGQGPEYIKDSLIAWYDGKNHDSNSQIWKDLSGNGNHGRLEGFLNDGTDGWENNYLKLYNNTNRIYMNGLDAFPTDADNAFSIEVRMQFLSKAKMTKIIEKRTLDGKGDQYYFMGMDSTSDYWYFASTGEAISVDKATDELVHTFTAIYDKTTSIQKFYIDGILISEAPTTFQSFDSPWKLTGNSVAHKNVLSVRMYNKALTEDEVYKNYTIDTIRYK